MLVKVFDETNEKDLEQAVNAFLMTNIELIDIKYSVGVATFGEEQIYCFTAMIIYRNLSE